MTLILATRTSNWVAIAADRMISINGQSTNLPAIKLVLFYNAMIFGYTGTAVMPDDNGKLVGTDDWLATILASVGKNSISDAIEAIRDRASGTLARHPLRYSSPLILEFIGVGWAREYHNSTARGLFCRISNRFGSDGQKFKLPSKNFIVSADFAADQCIVGNATGCTQTPAEMKWLQEKVVKSVYRGKTAFYVVDRMKDSIRQTSNRLNGKFVGKEVIATIIPRGVTDIDPVYLGNIQTGGATFFQNNFPVDPMPPRSAWCWSIRYAEGRNDGVYYSPHLVAPGFTSQGLFMPKSDDLQNTGMQATIRTVASGSVGALVNLKSYDRHHAKRPKFGPPH
jgi:hypothetical protein